MARKKIIAGNWKMNMTPTEAVALVNELKPLVANDEVDVVFCVPAIDIIPAMEAARAATSTSALRICTLRRREPSPARFPRICWWMPRRKICGDRTFRAP